MPELPDVVLYIEHLERRVLGRKLERVRIANPFLVRSWDPPIAESQGKCVLSLRRLGKRIVLCLEGDLYLVLHLMIAGRLRWGPAGTAIPKKLGLAAFDFPGGTLILTEAGTRRRASLHLVRGAAALSRLDPGGLEVLEAGLDDFSRAVRSEVHTLKRTLCDPRILTGIGNAYSDEILHAARLSPLKRTDQLDAGEVRRLYEATRSVLCEWIERLRREAGTDFPGKVTAFREGMRAHGRYRKPCPDCGTPIQRIVYAENETNYCPSCQTGGRILADRALSRLLKGDWPRTIEELEGLHREK
jgi:formamidopyrimidine-DNA glycosylase